MSYQAWGGFGLGEPPPPLRMEPSLSAAAVAGSIAFFSICVIWPIFSSRVIWPSSAATRSSTGFAASIHGRSDAPDPADVGPGPPGAPDPLGVPGLAPDGATVPHPAVKATTMP